MASPIVNGRLVTVKNSDGRSLSGFFDLDANLASIREQITKLGVMKATDAFVFNGSALEVSHEAMIPLSALLKDADVLEIGVPGTLSKDAVDYATMDYNEKVAFLGSGIANINVFNGLTVESDSSDKVRFVRKFHPLFRFENGYYPREVKPEVLFDFESLLTFSEEGHSMHTSGVNASTISLSKPWATAQTSFDDAKKQSPTSKKVLGYFTERLVCDKVYLSIDPEQITPDYGFIQKVKAALTGKDGDVDKYQALVEVLNEWGWYVPLNFTLGSALYATQIKEVDSFEQARTESTNFSANFKTEFKQLAGGAGNSSFFELGGSIIGKDNFNDWLNSLDDATTWDVIGYTKLYPSLMLLNNTENATLTDCLGLLRKFYTNQYVKDLQKYISVKDYEFQIAKIVSPVYE